MQRPIRRGAALGAAAGQSGNNVSHAQLLERARGLAGWLTEHLRAAGITSIVWAAGYAFDFDMVKLPVLDSDGYPVQQRGVTAYPGLYFVGLPWLYKQKSGLLSGVGDDAAHIVADMMRRSAAEAADVAMEDLKVA